MKTVIGILIPFLGTGAGSLMVFFMKNKFNEKLKKMLLGIASGVMIAASIWSLLIPAVNMAEEQGKISWIPAVVGFVFGVFFLLIIDKIAFFLENNKTNIKKFSKVSMLVFAVTLHNIPEGMAVGVAFAGALSNNMEITIASAFSLAIGIAIQNFPEGAIISMPLKSEGMSKIKSFIYGVLSGIVEPIFAFSTILLTNMVVPLLPYLLAFAAGAMIYVVVNELIPESQEGKLAFLGTIGVTFGFLLMMVLDITLG